MRAKTVRLALAALLAAIPSTALAQRPNQGEDESQALVNEGRQALRAGQLDDAAKALDQAISLNGQRVEAYVLRAAVYGARKQYAQAIKLMRAAQTLAPNDIEVQTQLGIALVESGAVDDGVPVLQQVVAKDPAHYAAQLVLGENAHTMGRWPNAITAFEAYFAHRPNEIVGEDGGHLIDLGDSYLRYRNPQKALELFERAATTRKDDLRVRIGIAWATAAIDCRRARPVLQQLSSLAEAHPEI